MEYLLKVLPYIIGQLGIILWGWHILMLNNKNYDFKLGEQ